jgi:prolyl 4-hydroxylase
MQKTLVYIAAGVLLITVVLSFLTDLASWLIPLVGFGIAVTLTIIAFMHKKDDDKLEGGKKVNIDFFAHDVLKGKSSKTLGNKETPIYIIDNFLTPQECNDIIKSGDGKLVESPLTHPTADKDFRTSLTSYFEKDNKMQKGIEDKIANFIEIPIEKGELAQIQKYNKGNQFKGHWDYFHEGGDYKYWGGDNGQRTWTFMIYLNEPEKGGSTEFIKLKDKIQPKTGRAVVWHNLNKDGSRNEMTYHAGRPIEAGEKHIITKWFRDRKQT